MSKQQPKADCFAFKQGLKSVDCYALKRLYCTETKCSFYMTKDEYKEKTGETYETTLKKLDGYNKAYKYAGDTEEE